jgi:hypothetical protein
LLVFSVVIFGGGLFILPGRNFARFNLMLFILFCLVIRTGYQGVQFDIMLKEMRPKDVQTIDELIERNFTIYGNRNAFSATEAMEIHKMQVNSREMTTNDKIISECDPTIT